MDILSLFTDGKGAPVTADTGEDENKTENPLQNSAFGEVLARSVEGEVMTADQVQAIAQLDGLSGQQISAQMVALIGQQENSADAFTREEAELWVAEVLEQEGIDIDLSLLDREKIIQILLGIEEEPLEEVDEVAAADADTEAAEEEIDPLVQAQQTIMANNQTLEAPQGAVALAANVEAANDNALDAAYIEVQAKVQDVMTVVPAATVTVTATAAMELDTGLTVADAAITQAIAKAREAFDKMTQVIPPHSETTGLVASDLTLEEFTPVALLDGAYVPATEGNAKLVMAEQAAKHGIEIAGIDRAAALTNVGVKQEGEQTNKAGMPLNNAAETAAPKTTQTETVIQPQLAVADVQKDEAVVQLKQSNETVQQQQAANHTQQHSAQAWERSAQGSDRVYTMQPGAQAGNAADQVNVSIKHGINSGIDRMVIQLDPADLGRVEIKMDVQDGRAHVLVTAEKTDTLDLLQRDARSLERALAEAGLDADTSGMEFQLGGQENEGEEGDGEGTGTGFANDTSDEDSQLLAPEVVNYTVSVEEGLNITV